MVPIIRRLIISLTTTPSRIQFIEPVVRAVVEGQSRPVDAVTLAVGVNDTQPAWLTGFDQMTKRPGILRVLRMQTDYGPAAKLLAVLREGGERSAQTVVIFCDDDVLMSPRMASLHYDAQARSNTPTAFGSRAIRIGSETLLEATGSVSVRASWLPEAAFSVATQPDACRLSDDYWISHHLQRAGVTLAILPNCKYNFNTGRWPPSCGQITPIPRIGAIGALSSRTLSADGSARRGGGDWRDQLRRYEVCQKLLLSAARRHRSPATTVGASVVSGAAGPAARFTDRFMDRAGGGKSPHKHTQSRPWRRRILSGGEARRRRRHSHIAAARNDFTPFERRQSVRGK